MLLKYHPELQFRSQSYKHLRTHIALFLHKRKIVASIHLNKIRCIFVCFQDQAFSLQFHYNSWCKVHASPFQTYCVWQTQMQVHNWTEGPCDTLAWGHFFSCKQSQQGQHQRTWPRELQASTPGGPGSVQVMQQNCNSYFHPIAEHQWGCESQRCTGRGDRNVAIKHTKCVGRSNVRLQWQGHTGAGSNSWCLQ